MLRQIIQINGAKCNGCGLCVSACHEGAISIVDGKALLAREDFCDGLGDCLPACPKGAISFERREALLYNEGTVDQFRVARDTAAKPEFSCSSSSATSQLRQWPLQLKLAPITEPFYNGADILVAADCCAYACATFHDDFMRNRVTLIGCPKLDAVDYATKLAAIFSKNATHSVTLARMEVPCCKRLQSAVERALDGSRKQIPLQIAVISRAGRLVK